MYTNLEYYNLKNFFREFSGGPVVKTMLCLRWPWWGKYDPTGHAVWLKKMKNKNIFYSLAFQLLTFYIQTIFITKMCSNYTSVQTCFSPLYVVSWMFSMINIDLCDGIY